MSGVVDLVVDTCVLFELSSWHDLTEAKPGEMQKRMSRARGSLSLGWFCHRKRLTGVCQVGETHRVLDKKGAGPDTQKGVVPWMTANFLLPKCLPNWRLQDTEQAIVEGNAMDCWLVDFAKVHDVPLLTREEHEKNALRRHAQRIGVEVLTPEEWIRKQGGDVNALASELWSVIDRQIVQFANHPGHRMSRQKEAVFRENCRDYKKGMRGLLLS